MTTWRALYAPVDRFLPLLAAGWELPFIVEPMVGHHGYYSILLTQGDTDAEAACPPPRRLRQK